MFLFGLTAVCLIWMHVVVRRMTQRHSPHLADHIESPAGGTS
jgi:hypothetical protein